MSLCEKCKGTGFLKRDDGTVEFCSCRFNSVSENKILRIPKRYWHAELKELAVKRLSQSQHRAIEESVKFIKNFNPEEGKGITFIGSPGVYKTYMAVCILKEVYRNKRIKGLFFDTKDLLYTMKMLIEDRKDLKLLKALLGRSLLVLDDLGSERLSDWQREILSYIISHRYNNLKSTIITTNYTLNASENKPQKGDDKEYELSISLENRLGSGIARRIREMTRVVVIRSVDEELSTDNRKGKNG